MSQIRPYRDELEHLYRELFGRALDHSGYFTYATRLESGDMTLEEVERILKGSDEFKNRLRAGG